MRARGEQPENGEGISEEAERRITYAIAIAAVCLIPSLVLGVILWNEIDDRTDENKVLIAQLEKNERQQVSIREEVRRTARTADLVNCEADEKVKASVRQIVSFKPEQVRFTLVQLGIDPESPRGVLLTKRARASAARAVNSLKPRDCLDLPDPTKVDP